MGIQTTTILPDNLLYTIYNVGLDKRYETLAEAIADIPIDTDDEKCKLILHGDFADGKDPITFTIPYNKIVKIYGDFTIYGEITMQVNDDSDYIEENGLYMNGGEFEGSILFEKVAGAGDCYARSIIFEYMNIYFEGDFDPTTGGTISYHADSDEGLEFMFSQVETIEDTNTIKLNTANYYVEGYMSGFDCNFVGSPTDDGDFNNCFVETDDGAVGLYSTFMAFSQSAEPTVPVDMMAVWRDTDDDKTYLIWHVGGLGNRKVEMT